jgi:hypothetical protein
MGVAEFLNYEAYINLQNKQLEIWGQPCTIYTPLNKTALGYENTNFNEIEMMNSDKVLGNRFEKRLSKIWINFTIPKKVFYHFNWFPEDGEELCLAFLNSESQVREGDYVRTATTEATSIWGNMIFSVKKIQDDGLANVLQRSYFLKPTNNADLHKELSF